MDIYHITSLFFSAVACLGVLISYNTLKEKKNEKSSDLERDVSIIKAARLTTRVNILENEIAVLEERLDNQIRLQEKLEGILDEIRKHCN